MIIVHKTKESQTEQTEQIFEKRSKAEGTKSIFDIEQHLETRLPLEWQQCLDVVRYFWSNMMSKLVQVCSSQITILGQIHFYNSRTHNRTSKDPRKSLEPTSPDDHMSLDLRLNLPCKSLKKSHVEDNFTKHSSGSPALGSDDLFMESSTPKKKLGGLTSSSSWLAFEGGHQEMVATVCTKCHMLVMLCKSLLHALTTNSCTH
ncbi:hypothetical protein CFP56_030587 [Quercus suber]|uniref:Uncharacterized protein n=1 Tax=Quercus suber TaxID=58331 RepID=A0AAW0LTH9_QUESU